MKLLTEIQKMLMRFRLLFFYLMNYSFYKKLEFRTYIFKSLRINGRKYISIYKNVRIKKYCWLIALKIDEIDPELVINEGCAIGDYNHIAAVRKVVFGRNVLTANNVYVSDNLHSYEDIHTPIMFQPVYYKSEVYIGEGSWIGENACIIGARIGKQCVVAANSVVTEDVPDYCVVAGVPARIIKRYSTVTNKWEKSIEQ
jgi:acetyltransferase-like isoleucine patch superfamily enzyme